MLIRIHGSPRVEPETESVNVDSFATPAVTIELVRGTPGAVARSYLTTGAVQLTLGTGGAITLPALPVTARTFSPRTRLVFRGPGAVEVATVPGPYPVAGPWPGTSYPVLSFTGALVSLDAGGSVLPFTFAELSAASTLDLYSSSDGGGGPDQP